MRIVGEKADMQAVFDKAFALVSSNSFNPALTQACVHFELDNSYLVGSNATAQAVISMDDLHIEDVARTDTVLLPSVVRDAIRLCDNDKVVVDISDDVIKVLCGAFEQSIRRESLDYPSISYTADFVVSVPTQDFMATLKRVQSVLKTPLIRPMLDFVRIEGGFVTVCDGSKLLRLPFTNSELVYIPGSAVPELVRHLRSTDANMVHVSESPQSLVFRFHSDMLVVPKRVDEYPPVDDVFIVPTEAYEHTFSLSRASFIKAVKRVALTADTDSDYLEMMLSGGLLTLRTMDKMGNLAVETLPCDWKGSERALGVTCKYLLDVLTVLSDTDVVVKIGDDEEGRMSFIRFEQNSDDTLGVLTRVTGEMMAILRGDVQASPMGTLSSVAG